jgi:hypothetical protein
MVQIQFFGSMFLMFLCVALVSAQDLDSTLISSDTIEVNKFDFLIQLRKDHRFYIIGNKDTLVESDYYPSDMQFVDFNTDGYDDIKISFVSNVPGIADLFLFDKETCCFKKIIGFQEVPEAIKLKGTNCYYSYHRSGCMDKNWDSDLFLIKNFKVVKIGNIHAVECDDENRGIFVYKLSGGKKVVDTIDILIIQSYANYKDGFLRDYWLKNFRRFD